PAGTLPAAPARPTAPRVPTAPQAASRRTVRPPRQRRIPYPSEPPPPHRLAARTSLFNAGKLSGPGDRVMCVLAGRVDKVGPALRAPDPDRAPAQLGVEAPGVQVLWADAEVA